MFRKLFQKAWSAAVSCAKWIGEFVRNLLDAKNITAIPLKIVRHDPSIVHACNSAAPQLTSPHNIWALGTFVKSAAAKASIFVGQIGLTNAALFLSQVAAMGSVAVGICVLSGALYLLASGAVWALKKTVKKAAQYIETLSEVEDVREVGGDFGFAT